jgi:peptidoglycan/xylan/chitin deacetylase (PgdA/CDA1 family)
MRYKVIKKLLSCILILLVFRIYFDSYNNNKEINVDLCKVVWSPDESLLNQVMAENKTDEMAWKERQNRYISLYPDMYVETINPVIHIGERKIAYMSFDDGPSNVTPKILDTLKEYDVKATFFIIAGNIKEDEIDILKRIIEEEHSIGIHTYSHKYNDIYSSVEAYLEDFYKVYQLIYEATGVKTNIFRFPWGSSNTYNKKIKKELITEMERRGFSYFDWNVSAEDSIGNPSQAVIKKNILKDLDRFNAPIVLMHDSAINNNTAKILPEILTIMKDKGYVFDLLENRESYHIDK